MAVARRRADAAQRWALPLSLAVVAGLLAGWVFLNLGLIPGLGLAVAMVLLIAALHSIWVAIGVSFLAAAGLPFATVPFSAGPVTLSLLEICLIGTLALAAATTLLDRRVRIPVSWPMTLWFAFGGYLIFAFMLGLGRGYSPQTLHDFFKFGLAFLGFWLVVQFVRGYRDVARVMQLLVAGATFTAAIGLVLYAGGASLTVRALSRLIPYGYPSGRIVRYIEDDPTRPMRLVSTGVDPNAVGGFLMIGLVLAASQLVTRHRVIPLSLALPATAVIGLATMLTYSRGAWVGAAAGIGLVLLVRARIWLVPIGLAGVAVVLLGAGGGFVQRLWLGFTLQDPATKLRLQEYQNALDIIQAHPWFGVGFGDAPSVNLQTGVSSIYLTIAEQAGLIGLTLFVIVVAVILGKAAIAFIDAPTGPIADMLLSVGAALASALTVGLVDHYYFNVQYMHMALIFWTLAGLLVVVASIDREDVGMVDQGGDDG